MMRSIVLSAALAATAQAANYVWRGRSTAFSDPYNWASSGNTDSVRYSPGNMSYQPGSVRIGRPGIPAAITSNVDTGNYYVGGSIEFDSAGTLVLGDGRGTTTLNFDSNRARTAPQVTLTPDFQFQCSSNWEAPAPREDCDGDSCFVCPYPTGADTISMPQGSRGNYMIAFERNSAAHGFLNSFPSGSCDNGAWTSSPGGPFSLTVMFSGLSDCNNFTYGVLRGDCPVNDAFGGPCNDDDDNVQQAADQAAATTAPSDVDSSSSSSEDDNASSTIVIVVVVAILIIIGVVVVVVVMVKKQAANSASDRGQVSFENPMYDNNGQSSQGQTNPMYDEPAAESSGYMDVPAGGATTEGSGYMDVAPQAGTTGYMDVAPGGFNDESDAEDV